MNEEVVEDLKQFISSTVSQQTAEIHSDIERLDKKIDGLDLKLSKKIDDLSDSVAEAIQISNDSTDEQLENHEQRIIKLEQRTT